MSAEPWVPSPAARPIWHLASGYASARRRRHPLWMLQAYFDDSGNGDGPVFILAGWLSTAERWAAFNEEWQAVLDQEPPLKRLKMQHAMTGSKVWRTWSQQERGARLDRFHSIVMRHAMLGFACAVHRDAYDEMLRQGLEMPKSLYWLAFNGVIAETMHHHRSTGQTDKVDFVFDEQMHEFPRALQAFLAQRQKDPYLQQYVAGTPRSASDDEVLPLQAADYLVWQLRRQLASMKDGTAQTRRVVVHPPGQGAAEDPRDLAVLVDVWDRSRLRDLRDDHTRQSLAELDAENLPGEMKERVRQTLLSRL